MDLTATRAGGLARARRVVAEAALVALVALVVALRVATSPERHPPGITAYLLGGLIAALLPWRRRAPLGVLLASVVLLIVYYATGNPGISSAIPLAVPLYAAAAAGRLGWAVGAAVVSTVGTAVFPVLQDHLTVTESMNQLAPQAALLGALVLLGDAVHGRRALAREAERAARHAVLDREREADRRVTQERLRIARELHDVLAHTLAGVAIQASVASDTLTDAPTTSASALEAVRVSCREARAALAATVGVLRADRGGDTPVPVDAPVPGLAQIDTLLDMGRAAGLRVEMVVDGQPRALPPTVELTAYRIIQESLTNIVQHAAARSAVISLSYQPAEVAVSVTDDGRGFHRREDPFPRATGGFGLVGMRERAAAVGGYLRAGNRLGGGFQVVAVLPAVSGFAAGSGAVQCRSE